MRPNNSLVTLNHTDRHSDGNNLIILNALSPRFPVLQQNTRRYTPYHVSGFCEIREEIHVNINVNSEILKYDI